MKLPFRIAVRFLGSSRGQTILIAIGIAIGVSVQIFIGSLIQGLQKSLVDKTIGSQPHITLTSKNDDSLIKDYSELTNKIMSEVSNIEAISASADGPALVKVDEDTYSVLLRGFDIEKADGIYNISDSLVEGTLPDNDFETLAGTDLMNGAGLKIGDSLELITNLGQTEQFKITGIFDLGVASLNKSWLISDLDTAQKVFSYDEGVTSIEMQVNEVFSADAMALEVSEVAGDEILVDNWKDQNAQLLSGLNGQSVSSIMIQVFVMISVLLGIASILAITVVQKSRQIGILKAMGIKDGIASLIFLFQGLLLGMAGAVLGVAFGFGLLFSFSKFALNPDGTPVVPLFIDYRFIALSAMVAVLASMLAALIPARKSSKLNPIEVIRNG